MTRNYSSSQRRYSDSKDDRFQGYDYLSRFSMRKRKSSSPDYPSRRPMEERTRYSSPSRSVKRRRYDDDTPRNRYPSFRSIERRRRYDDAPRNRYPSCRSIERRRRYNRHASRLSVERRRRRHDDAHNHRSLDRRIGRYDCHASRLHSVETRRYAAAPNHYHYHQSRRIEYVSSNHPSRRRSISGLKRREETVSREVSENFYVGTSRKTGISSNTRDIGSSLAANQDDLVTTWVGSFPGFLSDDLVVEILSRLPMKSLMRFKSVCKHWSSLIKHDPHFIDLHFNNNCLKSPSNLVCITGINPLQQVMDAEQEEDDDELQEENYEQQHYGLGRSKLPQQILCADIIEGRSIGDEIVPHAIVNKIVMTDHEWFDYENVLGLVNGLACFMGWFGDDVKLYNVSTREASPWIKSTLLSEERDKSGSKDPSICIEAIYRFGFDPQKKEHKVFCFCRTSSYDKNISDCSPDYSSCEVLAVGRDTKWRRINVVPEENNRIKINKVFPSSDVKRDPVYANGTIYWRNKVGSSGKGTEFGCVDSDDSDIIVALDVASEKFRVIPIPKFILDEPHVYRWYSALFMLRGRVAVICWLSFHIVKLWMLDDGDDKKLENCQGSKTNWISETIKLPYDYHCPIKHVEFHGFADQLVLSIYPEDRSLYKKFGYLHFYDSKKKTFNKIEIDGLSSIPFFRGTSLMSTSTGSLYPVQPPQSISRHFVVA